MALSNFNIDTTFGVEIEFKSTMSDRAIATFLNNGGLDTRAAGYTHSVTSYWKVVRDGSVYGGWELVSPILRGEAGLEALAQACRLLQEAGCTVDRACGVHVHLGVSGEDFGTIQRFAKNYTKFEDSFDCLVPPSRRYNNNGMIRSLSGLREGITESEKVSRINHVLTALDSCRTVGEMVRVFGTRYRKLNLESYTRQGTIEVRQHSGSLDADKLVNWVRLLGALLASSRNARSVAKRRDNGQSAKFRLKWLFNMTIQGETRRFFSRRARKLAA